jgi:hypothetical protein
MKNFWAAFLGQTVGITKRHDHHVKRFEAMRGLYHHRS